MRAQQQQKQRVVTLTVKGETVGEFVGVQFLPGYTFSWSPASIAMIAYANASGRLALMDRQGQKQQVDGTRNVILPAWSPDGSQDRLPPEVRQEQVRPVRRGCAAMKLPLAILLAGLAAQQPTFKSTTSLVEVDIIARDKDGRFVSGLTSDDFEVLEEGKPQAIQHFYLVTERATQRRSSRARTSCCPARPIGPIAASSSSSSTASTSRRRRCSS